MCRILCNLSSFWLLQDTPVTLGSLEEPVSLETLASLAPLATLGSQETLVCAGLDQNFRQCTGNSGSRNEGCM